MPRAATGPQPQAGGGRQADWDTGPHAWPGSGSVPPAPSRRGATGPVPQVGGPVPPSGHRGGYDGGYDASYDSGYDTSYDGGQTDPQGWPTAAYDGGWYPEEEPRWDGGFPETDPNLRYREPGPGMPGYRGSREHRYGGDRY
jgi:hypothetical protein